MAALAIIVILLNTNLRPRLVYAPCIYIGAAASFLAALAVGHASTFAIVCFTLSVMPEVGSFAIPFGLVATLNKKAEREGKPVSTALQMSLLNCCVTVGQQICTLTLAAVMGKMSMASALLCVFVLAGGAQALAGTGALFLDDAPVEDDEVSSEDRHRRMLPEQRGRTQRRPPLAAPPPARPPPRRPPPPRPPPLRLCQPAAAAARAKALRKPALFRHPGLLVRRHAR